MKRFPFIGKAAVAVLAMAALSAPGLSWAADKIKLSSRSTDWDIVLVESGIAAKYGIELDVVPLRSGPDVAQAIVGGSVDIASIGETPLTSLLARTDRVGVIGTAVSTDGSYVKVIVRRDAPFQDIADLKGRKIATTVGSGSHSALAAWCLAQGCKLEDFQILNTSPDSILPALESGSVDAGLWFAPVTTIATQAGVAKVLFDLKGANEGQASWIVNRRFAEARPELVSRFLAAAIEAQNILQNDHARAAALIEQGLQRAGRKLTAEQIQPGLLDFDYTPAFDTARTVRVLESTFRSLEAEGKLSGPVPDFSAALLPRFHAEALSLVEQRQD